MISEDEPAPAATPGRIALRSPLEAFLWIFITRLIALVTAARAPSSPEGAVDEPAATGDATTDPDRARRVAASRPPLDAVPPGPDGARSSKTGSSDTTGRAVALTAAATVVAGAAAFAAGRRRGRR